MRAIVLKYHGFDWRTYDPTRDGPDHTLRVRILGIGFDLRHQPSVRSYAFSAGVNWLLDLGVGFQLDTSDLLPDRSKTLTQASRYAQISGLGGNISVGQHGDEVDFKVFWRGKRRFWKRPEQ